MIRETKRKATWQELADKVDELQEKLDNSISKDKLIEIIDFGVQATNTNDDYSIGMCNGMLYIKSVILDKEAEYKKRQNNEEEKTYEFGLIAGTKREREYWQNKIRKKREEAKLPLVIVGGRRYGKTLEYGKKLGKIEAYEDLLKEE